MKIWTRKNKSYDLHQWSSNLTMYQSSLESKMNRLPRPTGQVSQSVDEGWVQRICFSKKFKKDAAAARPRMTP